MTDAIVWITFVLGVTYTITESALFMPVRIALASSLGIYVQTLVYCASCTGFWVGLGTALLADKVFVLPGVEAPDAYFWLPFSSLAIGSLYSVYRGEHPTFAVETEIIESYRERNRTGQP